MEIIRRFGLWIVVTAVALGAVGFYVAVVHKRAAARTKVQDGLEGRRDQLKNLANRPDKIPSPGKIEDEKIRNELYGKEHQVLKEVLAFQPRDSYHRRFYRSEEAELTGDGVEVEGEVAWGDRYMKYNGILDDQLYDAGFGGWQVDNLTSLWGTGIPTREEITAAMELYWFQRELADGLTGQVERDLVDLLKRKPSSKAGLATAADLVIDRSAADKSSGQRLENLLLVVGLAELRATLKAILINPKEEDLAAIFNEHLRELNLSWSRVLTATVDDEQRAYLDDLKPKGPDRRDPANLQRFVDYVMELRRVRYRSDVVGLLKKHGLEDLADDVDKTGKEDRDRLVAEIDSWVSSARLAQAIAAVVSIVDEGDYELVRDNHQPKIIEMSDVTVTPPRKGGMASGRDDRPGGAGAGRNPRHRAGGSVRAGRNQDRAASEDFFLWEFTLKATMEFEQIPVLVRRLLASSWRPRVKVVTIVPAADTRRRGAGSRRRGGMESMAVGAAGRGPREGDRAPDRDPDRMGRNGRRREDGESDEPVELGNFVEVFIQGEGYQYTPLRDELMKTAAPPAKGKNAKGAPARGKKP